MAIGLYDFADEIRKGILPVGGEQALVLYWTREA